MARRRKSATLEIEEAPEQSAVATMERELGPTAEPEELADTPELMRERQIAQIVNLPISKRRRFAKLADIGVPTARIGKLMSVSYAQVYVGLKTRSKRVDLDEGTPVCERCGKPLRDLKSTHEGMGPICRRHAKEEGLFESSSAIDDGMGEDDLQIGEITSANAFRRLQRAASSMMSFPDKQDDSDEPSDDELDELEEGEA